MEPIALRQLLYRSKAVSRPNVGEIVASSKRNNSIDGITGLLFFDGETFVQVLEGPENSVAAAFHRICADSRHESVTVISDARIEHREFAYWSMELREPGVVSDEATWRLRHRLEQYAPDMHHHFLADDPE